MPWGIVVLVLSLLSACVTLDSQGPQHTQRQTSETRESTAVRAVLRLAAEGALTKLSPDNEAPGQDIPLVEWPQTLTALSRSLRQYGLGHHLEKLEQQMNQGARRAAADMDDALFAAVDALHIENARTLIRGDEHAATEYFRVQMANTLIGSYRRLVHAHLRELGFHDQYRLVLDLYSTMPMNRHVSVNLEAHVVQQGLSGLLRQMAKQEADIRRAPRHQNSAVIERVFGR